MSWLKDTVIAIGMSAVIAAFFSFVMSKQETFMPWFAFALACSLGNSLIMTPTAAYRNDRPETTLQIFSGHTIHRPRLTRLKEPGIIALAIVLVSVLAWIFFQ